MSSNTAQATTPVPQNGTVPPRPVPQAQRRPREYLTPKEVERLIAAETVDPGARRRGAGPPLWRGPAHFLASNSHFRFSRTRCGVWLDFSRNEGLGQGGR